VLEGGGRLGHLPPAADQLRACAATADGTLLDLLRFSSPSEQERQDRAVAAIGALGLRHSEPSRRTPWSSCGGGNVADYVLGQRLVTGIAAASISVTPVD